MTEISERLLRVVDALPLRPGMRVLEVGGAPGAAARVVAERIGEGGHVTVLDRSAKGTDLTRRSCAGLIETGRLSVRLGSVEEFRLAAGEERYDLVFACRVGVLDGRHPAGHAAAIAALAAATAPGASLYIDTGDPLTEIPLHAQG